jgi:hypothetical protein
MIGFHEVATQFSLLPSSVFQIFFLLFDRVFFFHPHGARVGVASSSLCLLCPGDPFSWMVLAVHLFQIPDLHVCISLGRPQRGVPQ